MTLPSVDRPLAGVHPVGTTRRSLREEVATTLRGLLVSGQLAPGTVCTVPRLAAQFEVSATPVREALLDLAGAGLLEPLRNKGFRVTAVDDRTLDELAELRRLIEVPTMVAVARDRRTATAGSLEGLRPRAREIVRAAAAGDLTAYVVADRRFHLGFLALHANAHLLEVVGDLRDRSRLSGLDGLAAAGVLEQQAHEHEQLLEAALAHDTIAVRRLMTQHLGHLRGEWAGPR